MKKEYVKEHKIKDKKEVEKQIELIKSVIRTKLNLNNAIKAFEYAEGELIDYYSYQIKAEHAKLDYLIKKTKEEGIFLDMVNEIKIRTKKEEAG